MIKPVSVVVPKTDKSGEWFEVRCLPSIRENDPAEVIIENGAGSILEKRVAGIAKATQPYVLVGSEDMVLYEWALTKMVATLEAFKDVSFVYCDWREVDAKKQSPKKARAWDDQAVAEGHIRAPALVRREALAGAAAADPDGSDIWKALAAGGHRGLYISETLFELHKLPPPAEKTGDPEIKG